VLDGVVALAEQQNNKMHLTLAALNLSPIDKHVLYSSNDDALFHHSYNEWRAVRCNKIFEIYGIEYFKNKRILELGCGHGDIGALFAELGAVVVCLDGRNANINIAKLKHRNIKNITFIQCNLENEFAQFGTFDLIVNFGLIYHIKNVERHLACCFSMADDVLIETVVCDSTDPQKMYYCAERPDVNEEALEGVGSRPSPYYIERIATEHNFEFTRYFTSDLNGGGAFRYDWAHKNDCSGRSAEDFWYRRFWRMRKVDVTKRTLARVRSDYAGDAHDYSASVEANCERFGASPAHRVGGDTSL